MSRLKGESFCEIYVEFVILKMRVLFTEGGNVYGSKSESFNKKGDKRGN